MKLERAPISPACNDQGDTSKQISTSKKAHEKSVQKWFAEIN